MNYYEDKKEKFKKYRTNIKQNNQNYSITLFIVEEKLQISVKYSSPYSDEIFEYTNFYSFHQLKIINKYFRYFDNIEKICKDLDKLLKKNKVSIDDKNAFIILSIQVLIKKEKTNIIFKLKKKVTDYRRNNDRINNNYNNINNYNKNRSKNSISMPKYNEEEESKIKNLLNDLNDRVSMLENSHRYDSAPKEKMDYRNNRNNINNINKMNINESNLLLGNINNIMVRMNRLEDLNKEKDDRIKELEDKISKYENNLSNTMSYPTYSLPNKSQKSKNEKDSNIKKKENNNQNDGEYEYEINSGNNNNISKSKDKNNQKLRGKKKIEREKPEYKFKPIEESKDQSEDNNIKSGKRKNNIDNSKDENPRRQKKNNIKSKSQGKIKKSQDSNSSEDNEKKKNHRKRTSYSSQKESEKSDKKEKNNIKKRREEERKSESEDENDKNNKNEEENENSSEKEENNKKRRKRNNSNSSEEKNNIKRKNSNSSEEVKPKKKNLNKSYEELQKNKVAIGLPLVEREEDLKKYVNSRIFYTTEELQLVKNRITRNKEHLHCYFDILYRASIDRDYEETINNLCEGHYPQIILFYASEGSRFGVYIEKEKHIGFFGNESYKEVPGTCFLFSLNSLKIFDIKEKQIATDNRPERLCFGRSFLLNDNGSNWFIFTPRNSFLGSKCMIGDKESNFGIIDTSQIVGYKKDYILKEVEIFEVIFFQDDDEDDDDENTKFVKEKEIRVKNFSKKKRNNNDTIKIKNMKIENNEDD